MNQQTPHGVAGQLNVYVLDKDSCVTRFGKHNRLIVTRNLAGTQIEIREDDIGLAWSDEIDRQYVACKTYQRLHPRNARLVFRETQESPDQRHRWHCYDIVVNRRMPA